MKVMGQRSWRAGEAMELLELPTPEPRADEVRVAVKAIGVNPVDWKMRTMGVLRLAARVLAPPPPVVVGVDFAGVVEAVGQQVRTVKVGDRVAGGTIFARRQRGSYADTVVVREDQLVPVPDHVGFEAASCVGVAGVTARMAIVDVGGMLRGPPAAEPPRVLVLGASGGVGQLTVQVAKLHGAFVVGVCSAKNVERVRALGADVVLDYHAGDPLEQARALGSFRVVVDCVGSYSGPACRSLLGARGRHVLVSGDTAASLMNVLVPPFSSRALLARPVTAFLRPVMDALAAGKLHIEIAERIPLVEAERAHALSRGGRMQGKIVLIP